MALHKGSTQARGRGAVGCAVVHRGVVLHKTCLTQNTRLLLRRQMAEVRSSSRHSHIAPMDGGVGVVFARALGEAQAILFVSGLVRVVVDRAIPAGVAHLGHDHILLLQRESIKGQAIDRHGHRAPSQVLGAVVGADQIVEAGEDLFACVSIGIDKHGLVQSGVAQGLGDNGLLGGREFFKGRVKCRCRHAAPVDALEGEVGCAHRRDHLIDRQGTGVDPHTVAIQGVTQ